MSSFSYSNGYGATLSLRNVELPASMDKHMLGRQDTSKGHSLLRAKEIASLGSFDDDIDRSVRQIFDGVLEEIAGFFLSTTPQREDVFRTKRVARKVKTAIVQCGVADVKQLIDGVLSRMNREIGEHVVVKSGQADIQEVVNKFEGCSGKKKQLLVIEQAESLSSRFFNGLLCSLPTLQCDIIVLLCVSTKQVMFTSRVSRRCLALLHTRRFLFSLSSEVFHSLVSSVLLNPSFTDLRLQPGFLRFIRYSFLRDEFSVSHLKKCIRFGLLHRLWMNRFPDISSTIAENFADSMDTYFGVLNFLHGNLNACCESEEYVPQLITLHEDVQTGDFSGKIANSSKYRDWTQSITRMSQTEIEEMLAHKGICDFGIKLQLPSQNVGADQSEALDKDASKSLNEKTSVLQLKNKMKEIISARQRNPQALTRQKLILDIESIFRSVLRPFTSLPHSRLFLFGDESLHFLAPNITSEIERSMLHCQDERHPLGAALRTLIEQGRWKTVPLADWGKSFVTDMMAKGSAKDKKQLESMFFACVGQLEHMGVIRASSNTKLTSVTVVYHILNFTF